MKLIAKRTAPRNGFEERVFDSKGVRWTFMDAENECRAFSVFVSRKGVRLLGSSKDSENDVEISWDGHEKRDPSSIEKIEKFVDLTRRMSSGEIPKSPINIRLDKTAFHLDETFPFFARCAIKVSDPHDERNFRTIEEEFLPSDTWNSWIGDVHDLIHQENDVKDILSHMAHVKRYKEMTKPVECFAICANRKIEVFSPDDVDVDASYHMKEWWIIRPQDKEFMLVSREVMVGLPLDGELPVPLVDMVSYTVNGGMSLGGSGGAANRCPLKDEFQSVWGYIDERLPEFGTQELHEPINLPFDSDFATYGLFNEKPASAKVKSYIEKTLFSIKHGMHIRTLRGKNNGL